MPVSPDLADGAWWVSLVDRYAGLVWAVPRGQGLSPTAAGEVAQTTWLRLVEQVEVVPVAEVGTWLARAARQECARAARWHDGARHTVPEDSLLAALEDLPVRLRLVLRLAVVVPRPDDVEQSAAADVALHQLDAVRAQGLERLTAIAGSADLDQLREAVDRLDPPPPALLAAARAAYTWRTLDAELAPLSGESVPDGAMVGVRGAAGARRMSFSATGVDVALEVSGSGRTRSLLGQLGRATAAKVLLRRADGSVVVVDVDDLGRFASDGLTPGPASLQVVSPDTGRVVHTDWVVL